MKFLNLKPKGNRAIESLSGTWEKHPIISFVLIFTCASFIGIHIHNNVSSGDVWTSMTETTTEAISVSPTLSEDKTTSNSITEVGEEADLAQLLLKEEKEPQKVEFSSESNNVKDLSSEREVKITTKVTTGIEDANNLVPEIKNELTLTNTGSEIGQWYTSGHYSAKYYYHESCDGWQELSKSYINMYNSESDLLAEHPSHVIHPECKPNF